MSVKETAVVQNWWDKNPYMYEVGSLGVGKQAAVDDLDLAYFEKVDRRFRKHSSRSVQEIDAPLLSRYVDYANLPGKQVLDIATGTGLMAVSFAGAGAHVTAVDISPYAVATAKRNFELRGLAGTVLEMDGQKLNFPDNSFDFVCAHGCLMHMPNTDAAAREIYRVLKPGGKIYIWMYHRGWYYWFGVMFLRGVLMGQLIKHRFSSLSMTSRYSDGLHEGGNPHTKFYSRRGFRRLFTEAGFAQIAVYANYNPSEWLAWPVKRLPLGFLVPKRVQKWLSERVGWALSCTITATKE